MRHNPDISPIFRAKMGEIEAIQAQIEAFHTDDPCDLQLDALVENANAVIAEVCRAHAQTSADCLLQIDQLREFLDLPVDPNNADHFEDRVITGVLLSVSKFLKAFNFDSEKNTMISGGSFSERGFDV